MDMTAFNLPVPDRIVRRTNKVALIDADFIKHYVTNNISKREDVNFDLPTDPEIVKEETNFVVDSILLGVECKAKVFLFSGKSTDTFREGVSQEKQYKGSRKARPPKYPFMHDDMEFAFNYIRGTQKTIYYPDLEADDLISILQTENTFIYSQDKDSKQIPGEHFDIKEQDFVTITEDQGWEFLMTQCLEGDGVDNIPGLPGHGPKSTPKVFNHVSVHGMLSAVQEAYMEKYGRREGFDMFVEQYSLLRTLINRGGYLKERCKDALNLITVLTI